MKKIISILLATLMLVSFAAFAVGCDDEVKEDDIFDVEFPKYVPSSDSE